MDEDEDFDKLESAGILDYATDLKAAGKIRHIGFSSHTPPMAHRILDTDIADMMMFSVNPAYDVEQGDEYGIGSTAERARLLRRCEEEGVGVSVMKPFHGGKLLDSAPGRASIFGIIMTFSFGRSSPALPAMETGKPWNGNTSKSSRKCALVFPDSWITPRTSS